MPYKFTEEPLDRLLDGRRGWTLPQNIKVRKSDRKTMLDLNGSFRTTQPEDLKEKSWVAVLYDEDFGLELAILDDQWEWSLDDDDTLPRSSFTTFDEVYDASQSLAVIAGDQGDEEDTGDFHFLAFDTRVNEWRFVYHENGEVTCDPWTKIHLLRHDGYLHIDGYGEVQPNSSPYYWYIYAIRQLDSELNPDIDYSTMRGTAPEPPELDSDDEEELEWEPFTVATLSDHPDSLREPSNVSTIDDEIMLRIQLDLGKHLGQFFDPDRGDFLLFQPEKGENSRLHYMGVVGGVAVSDEYLRDGLAGFVRSVRNRLFKNATYVDSSSFDRIRAQIEVAEMQPVSSRERIGSLALRLLDSGSSYKAFDVPPKLLGEYPPKTEPLQ